MMHCRKRHLTGLACLFLGAMLVLQATSGCKPKSYPQGAFLYEKFCANCHMEDGSGLAGIIPPLAGADYLVKYPDLLPCIIRYGQKGEIIVNGRSYNQPMPGVAELNDVEITNIINYINQAWGNKGPYFPLERTRKLLQDCELPPE